MRYNLLSILSSKISVPLCDTIITNAKIRVLVIFYDNLIKYYEIKQARV